MEPIKVSVDVNINLSEDVKSFIAQVFNGIQAPAPKPATTQASATTQAHATQASAAPAKPVSTSTAAPAINIETVRQALAAKVNSHREEIKAKLNELGSPSVTKLDPAKYGEMLSFLNSLS